MFYSLKRLTPTSKTIIWKWQRFLRRDFFPILTKSADTASIPLTAVGRCPEILVKRLAWIRIPYNRWLTAVPAMITFSLLIYFYPEYTKKFIKIHYVKYDEYLAFRGTPAVLAGPYALFLDSALRPTDLSIYQPAQSGYCKIYPPDE
jgi:hypothetical protein